MRDSDRTKAQLIAELSRLRRQLETLTALEAAHKKAEKTLAKERNLLQTIIDSSPDHIYVKDRRSCFITANHTVLEASGAKNLAEVVGKSDFDFHPPDLARQYYSDEQTLLEAGESLVNHEEIIADHKTGTRRWLLTTKVPFFDHKGRVAGLVGINRDITKRKLAEEALDEKHRQLQDEQEKSEHLLLNILPQPIAARLKQEETIIADSFDDVTVLFADVVNFSQWAARISPEAVVKWLNRVFSRFDQLLEKHGLEKIKTLGDAYMVVGNLPLPQPDHVVAMAELALEMLRDWTEVSEESLDLRIGFHVGPVVAGVIGAKKFSYDLWGDTVNLASRMESRGLPGRIQVTDAVYRRLQDKYRFEARGPITVKGAGKVSTYFLQGRIAD